MLCDIEGKVRTQTELFSLCDTEGKVRTQNLTLCDTEDKVRTHNPNIGLPLRSSSHCHNDNNNSVIVLSPVEKGRVHGAV